jgi:hypothetical protein|tara:strand:+ start:169 stop:918 length:750 start_codon:yes stop_codon:yes gene_type:complete
MTFHNTRPFNLRKRLKEANEGNVKSLDRTTLVNRLKGLRFSEVTSLHIDTLGKKDKRKTTAGALKLYSRLHSHLEIKNDKIEVNGQIQDVLPYKDFRALEQSPFLYFWSIDKGVSHLYQGAYYSSKNEWYYKIENRGELGRQGNIKQNLLMERISKLLASALIDSYEEIHSDNPLMEYVRSNSDYHINRDETLRRASPIEMATNPGFMLALLKDLKFPFDIQETTAFYQIPERLAKLREKLERQTSSSK